MSDLFGSANADHLPPSAPSPTGRQVEKSCAEQEARNAGPRGIDYSHIPPLRIADRYAAGSRYAKGTL